MQGYEQSRKVADTPFPFPWAQMVVVLLVIYTITVPLLIIAYVNSTALATALSVISAATYWALNEVARDTEDPFMYEPNDLPLATLQFHFNELLLAQLLTIRPPTAGEGAKPSNLWQKRRSRRKSNSRAVTPDGGAAGLGVLGRISRVSSRPGTPTQRSRSASGVGFGQMAAAVAAVSRARSDCGGDDIRTPAVDRGYQIHQQQQQQQQSQHQVPQLPRSKSLTKLWQEQQDKWQQQQQRERDKEKRKESVQELLEGEESVIMESVVLGMPPAANPTAPT